MSVSALNHGLSVAPAPAGVPDGNFLPPLAQKPIDSRPVPQCIVSSPQDSFVSQVFSIEALVQTVADFLSVEDTVSVERTCVAWSRWVSRNAVWRQKCDQEGIPPIQRKGKDPKTGQDIILYFYKEAYVRLRPMIFGPKQYSDCLGVKPAGKIRRLKDSIHDDINRLDPSYLEPLPLQLNAQRKYRLFYLSREIERPTLNGDPARVPMTINLLGELASKARNPTEYDSLSSSMVRDQRGNDSLDGSDWVLMSAEVIPETPRASYPDQVNTVTTLGARPPKAIEAIALNFFNYFRFGTRLFGQNSWTYSRTETTITFQDVQYRVIVGAFGPSGVSVHGYEDYFVSGPVGMAAAFSCGSS